MLPFFDERRDSFVCHTAQSCFKESSCGAPQFSFMVFVRDSFKKMAPKDQRTRGVEPELSKNEEGGRLETLSDRFGNCIDVEGEEIADVLL